jgi:hypothetical protein
MGNEDAIEPGSAREDASKRTQFDIAETQTDYDTGEMSKDGSIDDLEVDRNASMLKLYQVSMLVDRMFSSSFFDHKWAIGVRFLLYCLLLFASSALSPCLSVAILTWCCPSLRSLEHFSAVRGSAIYGYRSDFGI